MYKTGSWCRRRVVGVKNGLLVLKTGGWCTKQVVGVENGQFMSETDFVVCRPRCRGNGGEMSSSWRGRGDVVVTGGIFDLLKQKAKKKRRTVSYAVVVSVVVATKSSSSLSSSWLVVVVVIVACHRHCKLQRKMTPGGGPSLV